MPHYAYEVRDPKGNPITGRAIGPTQADVILELKKVGYTVVKVWEQPPYLPPTPFWAYFQRVPVEELALLTRQLAMYFSSGVGLLQGLECIQGQGFSKRTTAAVKDVARGLGEGKGLAASMALRTDVFSPVYIRLVHAGEISGALEKILANLADFLEQDLLLRRRLKSALAYPMVIFTFSVALIAFLLFFIFPMFIGFFEGLNMKLPAITQSLLDLTNLSREPLVLALVFIVVPWALVRLYRLVGRSDARATTLARWKLRFPLAGPLLHNVLLARFAGTLAILMRAGIPQMTALGAVGAALDNRALEKALERVAERVKNEGINLSAALIEEPLFPRMLVSLVAVGDEVGDLPRVLELSGQNLSLEVDTSIARLTVVIEPVMLGILGLFVGYILLAVFLPVYAMVDGL